jgi:hypothetical protein
MKKLITFCIVVIPLAGLSSFAPAAITNGGFESGMTGWTAEYANDGSNYGYNYELSVTDSYHYSGDSALWGKSYIVGDYSYWAEDDWARTYVWSDSQDLSSVTSIQLHLTDFQSNPDSYNFGWGWGQEVFLMLDDGTNQTSVLLAENHQHPYGTSLIEAGEYTISTGGDGRDWYDFDVPLDASYFGGLSGLDLTSAKVGIYWEAINWNSSSQTLWAGAAVDDIQLVYTPEPATMSLLGLGAFSLIRRKRSV